jgi:YD repeat-containing protein
VGTPMWRRYFVAILIAVVALEAGIAPASAFPGGPGPQADARTEEPPLPVDAEESAPETAEPTEVVELRTETSRTTDNGDGTLTAELFSQPIHYKPDESAAWQPVDVGFEPSDDASLRAESDEAPVSIGLADANDPSGFVRVDDGDHPVAFTLLGAGEPGKPSGDSVQDVQPAVDDKTATYAEVLPGLDLQIHAGASGPKTFVVLDSRDAGSVFTFGVNAPGLDLKAADDGGISFVDAAGDEVGRIPQPYAVDSSVSEERGSGDFTDRVTLVVSELSGQPAVVVAVDPVWLEAATYPVYVDPTFYPSTTAYGDAFVSQAYPSMNFADYVRPDSPYYHEHWLGMDPTNSSNVNFVYLRFDLSSIEDTTITDADLKVVPYHQYYNAPLSTTTWVARATSSWAENTLTWNNKPGHAAIGSAELVEGQWGVFNVTSTVQAWASGTQSNYGFKLHENGNNGTHWKRLKSYEEGGSHRPHLVVTYHVPTATTTTPNDFTTSKTVAWTYADTSGHAQSHFQVQVGTDSTFSPLVYDSGAVASAATSHTITATLTSGTQYFWRVRVKDGTSWSPYDSTWFMYDTTAPTGTVSINGGAASTNTSAVGLALNAPDAETNPTYSNDGRSLTSIVGCGSTTCGSFQTPTFGLSKAQGAIVAHVPTSSWHTITVDPTATGRATLAFDVMRESAANTYVGVVSNTNDGLRFELRGNAGLTTLAWTATSTPGDYTTQSVNYDFTPGVWYRFVVSVTGAPGTAKMWWFPRDSAMPAAPHKIITGVHVPFPRLHLFSQAPAGQVQQVYLDDIKVAENQSGFVGSGTVAVRLSPDSSTWSNWMPYADAIEYTLPAGAGARAVYAQFRDGAGNASSTSVSDTINVAFDNLGRQAQHSFESWDLGAGDEAAVNLATGNLVVTHPLVTLPYRGGNALPLTATYNAHAADSVGLGVGWQLNLQRRLILNGDNTVTVVDGDGARHTFTAPVTVGTVTTYARPARLYATLVKDTAQDNEYTLRYRDQSVDRFDISGSMARLASIEDRHANAITLAYDGNGNLATATDPSGRQVAFSWDTAATPDRLTTITDWAWIDGTGVVQTSATGSQRTYRFFFDGSGNLAGWSDPLNTSGSCPTGGSHLTCLAYTSGLLSAVAKTQTYTTFNAGTLGTATRTISTGFAYAGSRVASVTDAESNTSLFVPDGSDRLVVRRPTTTTTHGFQATADAHARVANVWRQLDPMTEIERRTTWDTTYPVEPATVTDNYGALENAPARTLTYTYQASSLGLLAKLVEPLTASDDRWTEYTYNANNDVASVVVSLEGSATQRTEMRYCYSTAPSCPIASGPSLLGRVDSYVDGTGGSGAGIDDADSDVRTDYGYDAFGQQISTTRHNRDGDGAVLDDRQDRFTYDSYGNLASEIVNYADGSVTGGDDITPGAASHARTDLTTTHGYDTAGNRISSADPRRAVMAATGSPAVDDYIGRWTFDALNQQVSERTATTPGVAAAQRTATMIHDELGLLRSGSDFGGLAHAVEYNRAGLSVRTFEDPDGAGPSAAAVTTLTTFDGDGRVLTAKDHGQVGDSSLGQTSLTYDALGRQLRLITAVGTSTEATDDTTYDGLDRAVSVETGSGSSSSQLTTIDYDLGGRRIQTNDGFTCSIETFDYRDLPIVNASGLSGGTCETATESQQVTHTHDGLGRLTRVEMTSGPRGRSYR